MVPISIYKEGKTMKNTRKTGSIEIQKQISRIRDIYESIGMPIGFETAVDLNIHLGKALELAKQETPKTQKKRYVM